jgi:hypothetical protein
MFISVLSAVPVRESSQIKQQEKSHLVQVLTEAGQRSIDSMNDVLGRAATRAVAATAVEKWAVEWSKFSLTGRHGQRHGRDGR